MLDTQPSLGRPRLPLVPEPILDLHPDAPGDTLTRSVHIVQPCPASWRTEIGRTYLTRPVMRHKLLHR